MRILRSLAVACWLVSGLGAAQDVGKEEVVAAEQLTKAYAQGAADFDKAYKGKTLTVEGVVKAFAEDYPPSPAVKAEVKKLQGKWKVVAHEANGKKLQGAEAPFTEVRFEGYNVYLGQGDQALHFGLSVDPGQNPKRMELVG